MSGLFQAMQLVSGKGGMNLGCPVQCQVSSSDIGSEGGRGTNRDSWAHAGESLGKAVCA